jgi:hypothetical protein
MRMRGTDMFRGGDTGLVIAVAIIIASLSAVVPAALITADGIIATFRLRL